MIRSSSSSFRSNAISQARESSSDDRSSPFSSTPSTARPATGFSGESSFEPAAGRGPVSLNGAAPVRESEPGWFSRLFRPRAGGVPTERTHGQVAADEAQRSSELARQQEALIAASGGAAVQYTNANGQTEPLSFTRQDNSWRVADAHGNSFVVNGQTGVSADQLLRGTATFADYWSQYPTHLRDSAPTINLHAGSRQAKYTTTIIGNTMRGVMDLGSDDLDERTFDHEFGHGVGRTDQPLRGAPVGWEQAMQSDGLSPSQYANHSIGEDFAESWLAFVEARERGAEDLETLRQRFPNRVDLMTRVWAGTNSNS